MDFKRGAESTNIVETHIEYEGWGAVSGNYTGYHWISK